MGAFVSITLGGKEYALAELPRRANREWQKRLTTEVRGRIEEVGPLENADQVIEAVADSAELMMDLLIAYDAIGATAWSEVGDHRDPALPEREWIDTHATDRECYEGWKKVTAAASPFGQEVLRIAPDVIGILVEAMRRGAERGAAAAAISIASSRAMSSSRPSTAGPSTSSSEPSPMSSSPSTPRKPRSAAKRKRSRS